MTDKPAAFVLGLGTNGYGVVRSFGRNHIPTVGVYQDSKDFGRFSTLCNTHRVEPQIEHEEELCQKLLEWSRDFDEKPFIYASSDEYCQFLSRHQDHLSDRFRSHWLSPDIVARIVDKSRIGQVCQDAGILVPRTHATTSSEPLEETAREFSFPLIIKPNRSFSIDFGMKNFVADSLKSLLAFYAEHPDLKGKTIWQEIIVGTDENVYQCNVLVRSSGDIGALLGVKKVRQFPPNFGHMCYGHSEENEVVRAQSLKLLRFMSYRGLASLEFKRHAKDGQYYFIEMNPRLPWYNSLFLSAGVNFPYLAYRDLLEGDDFREPQATPKSAVYWVCFKDDLRCFLQMERKGEIGLGHWIQSLLKARSFAWWSPSDPKPFLRAILRLFFFSVRKVVGSVGGLVQMRRADRPL